MFIAFSNGNKTKLRGAELAENYINDYSVSSAKTISTEICALRIAQKSKSLKKYRHRQMMCVI